MCKKDKKLDGCCCSDIVWGMFREALPIVVRNHICKKKFNKDMYKEIFNEADKVWESNRSSEPLAVKPMAAVVSNTSSSEVAAVQKSQLAVVAADKSQLAVAAADKSQLAVAAADKSQLAAAAADKSQLVLAAAKKSQLMWLQQRRVS